MVKKYYNREEIAKILNVNILTIRNWVKSGYIKEYKISTNVRKPLYNLEEIEKKINLQFKQQYITIQSLIYALASFSGSNIYSINSLIYTLNTMVKILKKQE